MNTKFYQQPLMLLLLLTFGLVSTHSNGQTPTNFKVAFVGDVGVSNDALAVLNLIKNEGTNVVVNSGDMTYTDDPASFEANVNRILGSNFPYFWSAGNHDASTWGGAGGFQALGEARMNRLGIPWTGRLGVSSTFTYNGIFFVAAAPNELGVTPTQAGDHIRTSLAANNAPWSIAYWHKNQTLMQLGEKTNEAGWLVYEQSRIGGAIIATAHEHSYSRTYEMASMQNQVISSTANTMTLRKDNPATTTVDEGRSFGFVSGLGGQSIRPATGGKENNPWWGGKYYSGNGGNHGVLFAEFNYNGDATLAHFYFKDINGVIADDFFVRTQVEAPVVCAATVPANLTSSAIQSTSALTSWSAVPDVSSYSVRYRVAGAAAWNSVSSTTTSVALTELTPLTSYEVQVSAVCSQTASSAFSASHNFTTLAAPDTQAPSIPTGLSASGVTSTSAAIAWAASTDNVGVTGYNVYRSGTLIGSPAGLTFNVTGLTPNTAYSFTVRAKDAAGNLSANSTALSVTTLADPQPSPDTQAPSVPTSLSGTATTTSVALSWAASTDNVGVTGYDIFRGATNVGVSTTPAFTAIGLTPGTAYTFSVRAKDAAGNLSANSTALNVTTLAQTSESVLITHNVGGDKVEVNLGQNGAQSFLYGTAGAGTYTVTKVVLYISKDVSGVTQNLQVNIGRSVNGNPVAGSSVGITPASITNVSEGKSFQTVTVQFSTPVSLTAGTTYYLNFSNVSSTGKKYYLSYRPTNGYADGSYFKSGARESKDIQFLVYGTTPVATAGRVGAESLGDEIMANKLVRLFPNPASIGDEITIHFKSRSAATALIELVSQSGKVAYTERVLTVVGDNLHTMKTASLGDHFYVVRVILDGAILSSKLLIAK